MILGSAARASREVTRVVVRGELPAGGTGFRTVEIAWREGAFRRYAEVLHVRGDATDSRADLPRTRVTPSARLQESAPDLVVVRDPLRRLTGGWAFVLLVVLGAAKAAG